MFIVFLKFSESKSQAGQFMEGHNAWIQSGFADGIFLLVGSIVSGEGGAIVAHNTTLAELQARVDQDPFVTENVVSAEITEISPAKADDRLAFLLAG